MIPTRDLIRVQTRSSDAGTEASPERDGVREHFGNATLIGCLRGHAAQRPDQLAFAFAHDGRADLAISFSHLDRRARAIAARLQQMELAGERVILAYPQGLDFIAGFFGCLYAGCVAVPTFLPGRRTLSRFDAIVADAGARLVLSAADAIAQHRTMDVQRIGSGGVSPSIPWLATDEIPDCLADGWEMPIVASETLAMLQYTSGSTSEPKGVMLSHANLMHNTRAISDAFGMRCGRESGVFWLPTYHDMGLVGGVLVPVLAGATSTLMAPSAFLQHPMAWLDAISKRKATISGGPNFAYDLCARKITAEQRATLDLSSWSLAFVGAEPIDPETLERFVKAFASCGFDPRAFYPCYGMAEATLMISGAVRGGGAIVREFDETALSEGRLESVARQTGKTRRLVSCGTPVGDLRVKIVDTETHAAAAPNRVGEIWVAGSSIGQGYWHNADQTRRAFDAHVGDASGGAFLRTGDLGMVSAGELFVVGRHDDLIIVRGLNHHPQDIESSASKSHPSLETSFGAAFAVSNDDGQRIVLVHEVANSGETDFAAALEGCRERVLAEHGLALQAIVLVRAGTIPRTSSGKVRRRACREEFLAGTLRVVAEHHAITPPVLRANPPAALAQPASSQTLPFVFSTVCQHALAIGGAALSNVTPETPLTALGLDSLQRVELAATLEKTFACRLPDTEFTPTRTLGELADAVRKHLSDHVGLDPIAGHIPVEQYDFARFAEYGELKRYERMLKAVAGENPYFRVDQGGTTSASTTREAGRDLVNFGAYDYIGAVACRGSGHPRCSRLCLRARHQRHDHRPSAGTGRPDCLRHAGPQLNHSGGPALRRHSEILRPQ